MRLARPAALVLLLAGTLRAGFCPAAGDAGPHHDFQFFAGYSPASATLIGTTTDRRMLLAGFAYGYRCWSWNSVSISYTAAAMPLATLIEPGHSVYGFAVAPVGFTFQFARERRVHPFVETMGGIIASSQPIPQNQPDASGLNFFFDFGGGIRWRAGQRGAVSMGYRFLHISNAGTTRFNPGVDNNVFYAAYSFLR